MNLDQRIAAVQTLGARLLAAAGEPGEHTGPLVTVRLDLTGDQTQRLLDLVDSGRSVFTRSMLEDVRSAVRADSMSAFPGWFGEGT